MSDGPRILLAGGGTGGHALPGIAVARALRRNHPDARFLRAVTPRDEKGAWANDLLGEPVPIASPPLPRGALGAPRFALGLAGSIARSIGVLRRESIDAVLALGGYGSVGPGLAALTTGRPVISLEANAVPGAAVRLLHRWGAWTAVSFDETRARLPGALRGVLTGNPLREEVLRTRRDAALFGLDPLLPVLAVVGGSLGARGLNERVGAALPLLRGEGVQLLWITGSAEGAVEEARARLRDSGVPGTVLPWCGDMAALYGTATVLLSRSGGGAVAEAAAVGVPSIFVPYPHHGDRQQSHNAAALASRGGARVVEEAVLSPERLAGEVLDLLRDSRFREGMAAVARAEGRPHAADAVARLVLDCVPRLRPGGTLQPTTAPRVPRESKRVLQA